MATKATTKKRTTNKVAAKPATKKPATKAKAKTTTKAQAVSQKVDYYPNRVPFYTALLAVMILILLAVIVTLP